MLLGANLLELSHDAEREVAVHHLRLVIEDVVLPLQDARLALLKDGEPLGGVQRLLVRRERHERARVGDESGRDVSHAVVHRGAAAADVRCVRWGKTGRELDTAVDERAERAEGASGDGAVCRWRGPADDARSSRGGALAMSGVGGEGRRSTGKETGGGK